MFGLTRSLQDLFTGLSKLSFSDNFDSFFAEDISFSATTTVAIPNQLKTKELIWFPVRITGDARLIEVSSSPFTSEQVYIRNASSTATVATIVFMRKGQ